MKKTLINTMVLSLILGANAAFAAEGGGSIFFGIGGGDTATEAVTAVTEEATPTLYKETKTAVKKTMAVAVKKEATNLPKAGASEVLLITMILAFASTMVLRKRTV